MWHIRVLLIRLLVLFLSPVWSECLCGFKKQSELTNFVLKPELQEKYCPPLYGKNHFENGPLLPPPVCDTLLGTTSTSLFSFRRLKLSLHYYRERKTHLGCLTALAMSLACLWRSKATDAPGSQITPWISWAAGTSPNGVKAQRGFKRRLRGFITPIFTHTPVFYCLYKMFCISEVERGLKCLQVKKPFFREMCC